MTYHFNEEVYYFYCTEELRMPILLKGRIVGIVKSDSARGLKYLLHCHMSEFMDTWRFGDEIFKTLDDPMLNVRNFLIEGK